MNPDTREVLSPEEWEKYLKEHKELTEGFQEVAPEYEFHAARFLNGRKRAVAHRKDKGAGNIFKSGRRMKQAIRKKMGK